MSDQHRDEGERSGEKVTDQDVLEVLDLAGEPVLTANEVAAELPLTRSAVNSQLNRVHDSGLVTRKRTGDRTVIWWRIDGKTTAKPLRGLVGMLDEDEADRVRKRMQEFRDRFDREIRG